ncbi:AAA family ATPase [Clostridium butyricum]|uniref:AAA family ATPase n=1 Tax=Clostridium butyricum TaxID=1492 RepID=UPI000A11AB14|nr:ATP-binding protein [Clostridium butyricum]
MKKKHLILTGKNGSGKTSVLEALMRFLKGIEDNQINQYGEYENNISNLKKMLNNDDNPMDEYDTLKDIRRLEEKFNYHIKDLTAEINNIEHIYLDYTEGNFILAYFDAKRISNIEMPNDIKKIELPKFTDIDKNMSNIFLNYLVYLKTQQSFARNENDSETVDSIQKWFDNFQDALCNLFQDDSITLKFDYKNLTFKIYQRNRKEYGFESLSDGYSAVIDIVINLILRMEKTKSGIYDIGGIVIIDEVETHLHIELQKRIMPFLTSFFPNVQFIISTHSPFVLNSLENAVIYDLEKNVRIENLSGYAYDGIVESYFDIDKYSDSIKDKLLKYEKLLNNENKDDNEIILEEKIRNDLKAIPKELAPELVYKFNNLELLRKTNGVNKKRKDNNRGAV